MFIIQYEHLDDFHSRGRCREYEIPTPQENQPIEDPWFPPKNRKDIAAIGKKLCEQCPARLECFVWGVMHEDYGLWGGFSATKRVEWRKKHLGRASAPLPLYSEDYVR